MSDDGTIEAEVERAGPGGVTFDRVRVVKDGAGIEVRFDVGWDRSWGYLGEERGDNWDAAWVFFKYSYSGKQVLRFTDAIGAALDAGEIGELIRMVDEQTSARPESFREDDPSEGKMVVVEPGHWLSGRVGMRTMRQGQAWMLEHRPTPEMAPQRFEVTRVPGRNGAPDALEMGTATAWKHALVKRGAGDPPAGAILDDTDDRRGVFLRRSRENAGRPGPVRFRDVRLQCQLGVLDMEFFSGKIRLWPFGLEMVYVPGGPFWLGDPAPAARSAPRNCFCDARRGKDEPNRAYLVDSEAPIAVGPRALRGDAAKVLYYSNDDDAGGAGNQRGPIPEAFPKGTRAFYVMKRQVTQGQYAAFVNTLEGGRPWSYGQLLRYSYDGQDSHRGTIQIANKTLARVAGRPGRAHNHMCWGDGLAFAAWAGLRPMTELEYEKACRGPILPVSGEFSWGTTNLLNALVIQGDEDGTEVVTGNCNIGNSGAPLAGGDGGHGPVRDDAFAARGRRETGGLYSDVHDFVSAEAGALERDPGVGEREDGGLSYYGVAGLTGNLWELCVTVGTEEGRGFTGQHGAGELEGGEAPAKTLGWPSPTGKGPSFRGGSWYTSPGRGPVSARPYGSGAPGYYVRSHDVGFRAVRTAPEKKE